MKDMFYSEKNMELKLFFCLIGNYQLSNISKHSKINTETSLE